MSKAAGTLITTYNSTYIPPRFMPCYDGHVPTLKYNYGETYGKGTARYFQDYRAQTCDTSCVNPNQSGYFATAYSHRPDVSVDARTRSWERWLQAPRYRLSQQDHDRREEILHFAKRSMAHREHYSDKTSTVPKVAHFQLPASAETQFKTHLPFVHRALRYTDDVNVPSWTRQVHLCHYTPPSSPLRSTPQERAAHDLFFQNRQRAGL